MRTLVQKANHRSIARAARILRGGGVVAFPTETVYGLGARALSAEASQKIYRAKNRPADNPLIVHVADEAMLSQIVSDLSPLAQRLIRKFWPGPLTLIMDKLSLLPDAVTAGQSSVAVRCPDHPAAQALIRALGEPIAAPSANTSGRPSPTTAAHVLHDLRGRIPFILDGGACRAGLESTIVDARKEVRLLRPGAISAEALARAIGAPLKNASRRSPRTPGMRHRHYAPSCRVVLVSSRQVRAGLIPPPHETRARLICRTLSRETRADQVHRIPGGIAAYARALFAELRSAESDGMKKVYVETVPKTGIGQAVMDRLDRAAMR